MCLLTLTVVQVSVVLFEDPPILAGHAQAPISRRDEPRAAHATAYLSPVHHVDFGCISHGQIRGFT
jgi:hypothetical protein